MSSPTALCPLCGLRTSQTQCERCGNDMTEFLELWKTTDSQPADDCDVAYEVRERTSAQLLQVYTDRVKALGVPPCERLEAALVEATELGGLAARVAGALRAELDAVRADADDAGARPTTRMTERGDAEMRMKLCEPSLLLL